ncbi:MAG TPA: hypothetical protein VFW33_13895 [Gemmataceae bacterium]|nr:hypothetical protein [Gemmataceae bacterium]
METLRNPLQQGNSKLGEGIYTFSLPAVATCPGASPSCRRECYALRGRFHFLRRAYRRYLAESQADGFAARIIGEIRRRWVACVRIHVSGDFYSADYVRRWATIARAGPTSRRRWSSCPAAATSASGTPTTGIPASRTAPPKRVKLAWMQTSADDEPPRADLVFRVHRLRKTVAKRVALALVCPVENGATGHRTDCGRCRLCIN